MFLNIVTSNLFSPLRKRHGQWSSHKKETKAQALNVSRTGLLKKCFRIRYLYDVKYLSCPLLERPPALPCLCGDTAVLPTEFLSCVSPLFLQVALYCGNSQSPNVWRYCPPQALLRHQRGVNAD